MFSLAPVAEVVLGDLSDGNSPAGVCRPRYGGWQLPWAECWLVRFPAVGRGHSGREARYFRSAHFRAIGTASIDQDSRWQCCQRRFAVQTAPNRGKIHRHAARLIPERRASEHGCRVLFQFGVSFPRIGAWHV